MSIGNRLGIYTEAVATIADGSATVYFGQKIYGRVVAIKYTPGTLDTGADLTFTGETTGIPVLVKSNAGTSEVWFFPRVIPNKNTDGTAFTDVAEPLFLFTERLKLVVAQGGDTKAGSVTVYTEE